MPTPGPNPIRFTIATESNSGCGTVTVTATRGDVTATVTRGHAAHDPDYRGLIALATEAAMRKAVEQILGAERAIADVLDSDPWRAGQPELTGEDPQQ